MHATTISAHPVSRYQVNPAAFLLAMRRDGLGTLTQIAQRHGDIAVGTIAGRQLVLLSHPDLVREVLVTQQRCFVKGAALQRARSLLGQGLLTSEGEAHLHQRRLIQPAFHRERIADYAADMVVLSQRAVDSWQPDAQIDIADQMMRLTLAIAGKALFSADVADDAESVGAALDDLMGMFGMLLLPFGPWLERMPVGPGRRMRNARARLDQVIMRLIAERRTSGDRGDLLSMLLFAQDATGDSPGMSDQQARDEAMTLFLAGHETTASALSWAWYLLAQHPLAEARMHAEIDRVLGGRSPQIQDLGHLPYTRAVFSEAIRLFPPAWVIGRQAIAPATIGGYCIPAGSTVLMSPYVIQRDARFFPNPQQFEPERWLHEDPARPRMAYFPFGAGTRMCVGEQFAWMEGTLVLATIARDWQLQHVATTPVIPRASVTLRPQGVLPMRLVRRKAAPTYEGLPRPSNGACPFGH